MNFQRRPIIDGVLDFTDKLHKAIYDEGCKAAYEDYAIDDQGRHAFTTALRFKAKSFGWGGDETGILDVPTGETDDNGNPVTKYLLEHDGEFTLEEVTTWVTSYISQENRASQDDAMLFSCILNSLSSEGKIRVYNRSKDFMVDNSESGTLLLKVVLEESGLQTNATVMKAKSDLANLSETMVKLGHNVSKFNDHVLAIMTTLTRNGSNAPDLVHQLFPAYLVCPDKEFTGYIKDKKNSFEEGQALKDTDLMKFAHYKYKTLVDSDQWEAPDSQEEEIMALKCELKQVTSPLTTRNKRRRKEKDDIMVTGKNQQKKKKKGKKIPEWITTPPPKGGPYSKTVDGKVYHFCCKENGAPKGAGCNKWVRHKPSGCQGNKFEWKPGQSNPVTVPGFKAKNKKQRELQVKAATLGLENCSISDDALEEMSLNDDPSSDKSSIDSDTDDE